MIQQVVRTGDCIDISRDFTKRGNSEWDLTLKSDASGFVLLLFDVPMEVKEAT